jgi:hypothetical protein
MVRRHGEGGGISSPALMTASSSAGGRWWIAILLALRSREASSRELSMGFEGIYLQDGRFSKRPFAVQCWPCKGFYDVEKIDVFSVLSVFSRRAFAGPERQKRQKRHAYATEERTSIAPDSVSDHNF